MNYRKFYQSQLDYQIPPDWDIHHIDHNRANNELYNLVAIPKSLHKEYHKNEYNVRCIESVYMFTRRDVLIVDERFNFYDYSTGKFKEWYDLTETLYLKRCYQENMKARFMEALEKHLPLLNACIETINAHQISQQRNHIVYV